MPASSGVRKLFRPRKSTHELTDWSKNDEKLLSAVEKGEVDKINSILSKKSISPTKLDPHGHTCLHRATIEGNKDVVEALLTHKADPNAVDLEGRTPLHCAVRHGHLEAASLLIQHESNVCAVDRHKLSALHHACMSGNVDCVRLMIENGVPVYLQDEDGRPALFLAAQMNHVPITKELIDGGANVNTRDAKQKTALILATEYGNDDVVQYLISKGANVTLEDEEEKTAIWYAQETRNEGLMELIERAPEPKKINFEYLKPKPRNRHKRQPKPYYRIDVNRYSQHSIVEEATPPPSSVGSEHGDNSEPTDTEMDKTMDTENSVAPIEEFPEDEQSDTSEEQTTEREIQRYPEYDEVTEPTEFLDSGYQDDQILRREADFSHAYPPPTSGESGSYSPGHHTGYSGSEGPSFSGPPPSNSGSSDPGYAYPGRSDYLGLPVQSASGPSPPVGARPVSSKKDDSDDSHSDYPLSPEPPENVDYDRLFRDYQDLLNEHTQLKGELTDVLRQNRGVQNIQGVQGNVIQLEGDIDRQALLSNGSLANRETRLFVLKGLVEPMEQNYVDALEKELEATRQDLDDERERITQLEEDLKEARSLLDGTHPKGGRWINQVDLERLEASDEQQMELKAKIEELSEKESSLSNELSKSEKDLRDLAAYKGLQESHEKEIEYFMGKLDKMEGEKRDLAKKITDNETLERKIEEVQKSISLLMTKGGDFEEDDLEKLQECVTIIRDRSPSRLSVDETLKTKEVLDDENDQLMNTNDEMLRDNEEMKEELDILRGQMKEVDNIVKLARDLKAENEALRSDYAQFKDLLMTNKNAEVAEKADLMTWFKDITDENSELRDKNFKLAEQLQELETKLNNIIALGDPGEPEEIKVENVKLKQEVDSLQEAVGRQAASILELDEQLRNTKNQADSDVIAKISEISNLKEVIAEKDRAEYKAKLQKDIEEQELKIKQLDVEIGDREILQNNYRKLVQDNQLLEVEISDAREVFGMKIDELEKERCDLKKKVDQSSAEKENLEAMLKNSASEFDAEREKSKQETQRMHLVIIGLKERLEQKRRLTDEDLKKYDGEILPSIVYKVEKTATDADIQEQVGKLELEIYELKHEINEKSESFARQEKSLLADIEKLKMQCDFKDDIISRLESSQAEVVDAIVPVQSGVVSAAPPALPSSSPPTGQSKPDEEYTDLDLSEELHRVLVAKQHKEKQQIEDLLENLKAENASLQSEVTQKNEEIEALNRTIQELKVYLEKKIEDWEDDPRVTRSRIEYLYVLLRENPDDVDAKKELDAFKEVERLQKEVGKLQKIANERDSAVRKSGEENSLLRKKIERGKSIEDEHTTLLKDNEDLAVQMARNSRNYRDQIDRLSREKEHLVEENETLKIIIEGKGGDSEQERVTKQLTILMTTRNALEYETKRLTQDNEKLKTQYDELRVWAKKEQARLTEEIQTWRFEIELLRKIPAEERARLYVENTHLRAELESLREQLGDQDVEEVVFRGKELADLKAEIEALLNKSYLNTDEADDVVSEDIVVPQVEIVEEAIVPVGYKEQSAATPSKKITPDETDISKDIQVVRAGVKDGSPESNEALDRIIVVLVSFQDETEKFKQENKVLAAEVFSLKLAVEELKHIQKENIDLWTRANKLQSSKEDLEVEVTDISASNETLKDDNQKLKNSVESLKADLEKLQNFQEENESLKRESKTKPSEVKKDHEQLLQASPALITMKKRCNDLKEEQSALQDENDMLKQNIDELQKKLKNMSEQMRIETDRLVDQVETQKKQMEQLHESAHQESLEADKEQRKISDDRDSILADLEVLKERAKKREQELLILNDELEEENLMLRSEVERLDKVPKVTHEMEAEKSSLEEENTKLNNALDELQATLMKMKRNYSEEQRKLEDENTMLKSDIAILDSVPKYTKELQAEHKELKVNIDVLNDNIEELKEVLSQDQIELKKAEEQKQFFETEISKLRELREEKASLSFKNEQLTKDFDALSELSTQQKKELNAALDKVEKIEEEDRSIRNENGRLILIIATVENKLKDKSEECERNAIENDAMKKECMKLADSNDDLKSEVAQSSDKIKELEAQSQENEKTNAKSIMIIGDLKHDLEEAKQSLNAEKEVCEGLGQKKAKMEKELSEAYEKGQQDSIRISELEKDMNIIREDLRTEIQQVSELKKENSELENVLVSTRQDLQKEEKEHKAKILLLVAIQKERDQLQSDAVRMENEVKDIEKIMNSLQAKVNDAETLENRLQNLTKALEDAERQAMEEHRALELAKKELDVLSDEDDKLKKSLDEQDKELAEVKLGLEQTKNEYNKLVLMVDARERELGDREEEIDEMKSTLEKISTDNKVLTLELNQLKDKTSDQDGQESKIVKLEKENKDLSIIIKEIKADMEYRLPKIEDLEGALRERDAAIDRLREETKNPIIIEEITREEIKTVEAAPTKESLDTLSQLQEQNNQLTKEIQDLQKQLAAIKDQKTSDRKLSSGESEKDLKTELEKLQTKNSHLVEELSSLQEELNAANGEKEKARIKRMQEEIDDLKDQLDQKDQKVREHKVFRKRINSLEHALDASEEEVDCLSRKNKQLNDEVGDLESRLEAIKEAEGPSEEVVAPQQETLLSAPAPTHFKQLEDDNAAKLEEIKSLEEQLNHAKARIMVLEITENEAKDSVPRDQYNSLLDKNMDLVSKIAELQEKGSLDARDAEMTKELKELYDINKKLRLEIADLKSQLERSRNELMLIDIRHEKMVNEDTQTDAPQEPKLLDEIAKLRTKLSDAKRPEVIEEIVRKDSQQVDSKPFTEESRYSSVKPVDASDGDDGYMADVIEQIIPSENYEILHSKPPQGKSEETEVSMLQQRVRTLELEIVKLKQEFDIERSQLESETEEMVNDFQNENRKLKGKIQALEIELIDLQTENDELKSKLSANEQELSDVQNRIIALTTSKKAGDKGTNPELSILQEKNAMLSETVDSVQGKYQDVRRQNQELVTEAQELKAVNKKLVQENTSIRLQTMPLDEVEELRKEFLMEKQQLLFEMEQQNKDLKTKDVTLSKEQEMVLCQHTEIQEERREHAMEIESFHREIDVLQRELQVIKAEKLALVTEVHRWKSEAITHGYYTDVPPNTLVARLKEENCKLQEFVAKLHTRLDITRTRTFNFDVERTEHPIQISPATPTMHTTQELERQTRELRLQLQETERQHSEIICTYRTHLLAAIQGCIDPDVKKALMHIIHLRKESRRPSTFSSDQSEA